MVLQRISSGVGISLLLDRYAQRFQSTPAANPTSATSSTPGHGPDVRSTEIALGVERPVTPEGGAGPTPKPRLADHLSSRRDAGRLSGADRASGVHSCHAQALIYPWHAHKSLSLSSTYSHSRNSTSPCVPIHGNPMIVEQPRIEGVWGTWSLTRRALRPTTPCSLRRHFGRQTAPCASKFVLCAFHSAAFAFLERCSPVFK